MEFIVDLDFPEPADIPAGNRRASLPFPGNRMSTKPEKFSGFDTHTRVNVKPSLSRSKNPRVPGYLSVNALIPGHYYACYTNIREFEKLYA